MRVAALFKEIDVGFTFRDADNGFWSKVDNTQARNLTSGKRHPFKPTDIVFVQKKEEA